MAVLATSKDADPINSEKLSALGNQLRKHLPSDPETRALLQRAGDYDRDGQFSQIVRSRAQVGPEVSNAELKRAAADLLIEYTANHLEAVGRKTAKHRGTPTSTTQDPRAGAAFRGRLATRFGVAVDGSGPDPILKSPSRHDLARARMRLAVLRTGQKLSSEDTKILLQQTSWATRISLTAVRSISGAGDGTLTAKRVAGACGFGQACSVFHLQDLGIDDEKLHLHQAVDAFDAAQGFRHAFVVAEMPDGKPYLIDCTFRQFFRPDDDAPLHIGEPGRLMRETRRGRAISDELLAHGFIELTEEVASLYGASLATEPGRRYRPEDLLHSTVEIDYDRSDVAFLPPPPPFDPSGHEPRYGGPEKNRGPP